MTLLLLWPRDTKRLDTPDGLPRFSSWQPHISNRYVTEATEDHPDTAEPPGDYNFLRDSWGDQKTDQLNPAQAAES